uniref:Cytochrome P450 n=1 Tax=Leersia perrieri TaxID=77586 RepID=A0A0D9UYJ5_9ORYZ
MAVSLLVAVSLLAIVLPLLYIILRPRHGDVGSRRRLPPSARGLPLIGHLHLLGALPHRALRRLAAAHGPVLLLRLGRVPVVLVSRDVALVARVARAAASNSAVDLVEHLIVYSNAVVSRAAFGDESARGLYDGDRGREMIRKVFKDFVELLGQEPMGELLPWLGWRTFEALDAILEKVIDDHRGRRREGRRHVDDVDGDHRDFVDVLLDDMFVAGTYTMATVMQWAMAELIIHPPAMRKAQEEIRSVVGSTGHVTEDHMDKLPYLKAVFKGDAPTAPANPAARATGTTGGR